MSENISSHTDPLDEQSKIVPGSGIRQFSPEDIMRMRQEMLTSYAPDTLMPEQRASMGHSKIIHGDIIE